ncbi:uncharacterized protein TRAVEDRAFT_47198 [Trametes versicolor FP-101664 SS1]|uniref:uncharacterized protein n=1 Tax=Trametes versicolor (strain FP-101664) TaxID=717944 RepID=UPI0004621CA6|nr:uncharacterized protein TRAVEDRAFT_47198 [Trametes versicolor FP-101664 SS1]EIW59895.1 hypothetical protein TRAVEDRAFT_47198 [Trametes versicolor FP-101664 SS1]
MANPDAPKRVVNKGRLQTLPDLAVEIYNYLDLEDIFNLSRTSKRFRAFFADKNDEQKLWVPARENTPGLPDRPPWMGERKFAYLLYSPHCHNCGAPNIRKIVYGWFVRLCSACLQKRTIWYGYAAMDTQDIEDGSILRNMFYHNTITSHFHVEGYSHLTRDPKFNRLFVDDVNRVFEQFEALPDSADKKTFPDQVKAEHRARLPYANAIHQWMHQKKEQRLDHLDDVRQQRFDAILVKLRDAGWGKDLDFMGEQGLDAMYKMPVVRQSSKLTEGGWQKVLIVLDDLLKSTREKRLNSEYRQTIWVRFKTLERAIQAQYVTLPRNVRMDCRPRYIDLALTPECRAIIDVPMSEAVTVDDLAAVVPALVQTWEAETRKALTEHLLPHLGDIAADVDPLELAVSFFYSNNGSCTGPISIMRYPAILKHHCNRTEDCYRSGWYTKEEFLKEDLYTRTTKTLGTYVVDSESEILAHRENVRTRVPFHLGGWGPRGVVARMQRLVSAMGLDPTRATFEELERCDMWLRCTTCETENPNNAIFAHSWNSAYQHDLHHTEGMHWYTYRRGIPAWRHADEEDMSKIQAAKEANLSKTGGFYRCSCALCPDFDASADAMVTHLATTHDISDFCQARRDGVVYLHPHTDRAMAFADAICIRGRIEPKAN